MCRGIHRRILLLAVLPLASLAATHAHAATACEELRSLQLPQTQITVAETVPAGQFKPPGPAPAPAAAGAAPSVFGSLPAFCRVAATLRPSADSDIRMEVWLPLSDWNGKYHGVGNGAWSGSIGYPTLGRTLARGYAAAGSDTGHQGPLDDASFARGHPEKVVDFGSRAVHEMTVKAKAIIEAFYGSGPKLSYWNACSSGGRQGLREAQRFPGDYDGIVAGASANNWTRLMAGMVWSAQALARTPGGFPRPKLELLHRAVLAACDRRDGVADGVLENPTQCNLDPGVLQCKGPEGTNTSAAAGDAATNRSLLPGSSNGTSGSNGSSDSGGSSDAPTGAAACLTASEVDAARKIYSGPVNPRTGEQLFPGLERGSELRWDTLAAAAPGGFFKVAETHFENLVFDDPNWDFRTLNFDADVTRTDQLDDGTINATDPNLRAFIDRGGKLILWHGWTDAVIAPRNTLDYYERVVKTVGRDAAERSVRLFMVPGMDHCSGGPGPNEFDMLSALEQWVEHGKAPESVSASRRSEGKVDRTRPLCPWPEVARYDGSGSTDDAQNFACAGP